MSSKEGEKMEPKDELIEFEEEYPGRTNAENVDDIIDQLKVNYSPPRLTP